MQAVTHRSSRQSTIVTLVTVRLDSTRLPGKALSPIHGRASLGRLLDGVRRARIPGPIVVCTTARPVDDPLEVFAAHEGVGCYRGPTDDVLSRMIGAAERYGASTVVRVTGDDPLSDPEYIDRAIKKHASAEAEFTKTEGLPFGVGREVLEVSALQRADHMIDRAPFREHLTWFFDDPSRFRVAVLKAEERHRRPQYRLTLDYPEDLSVLDEIFRRLDGTAGPMRLDDVIHLLDADPALAARNAHCKPVSFADVFPGEALFRCR